MTRLTTDSRDTLLQDLTRMGGAGRAEAESSDSFKKTFYPVPEHARAFDPDVVLIVGERGSGKSELFRAVVREDLLSTIAPLVRGARLPPIESGRTLWREGYPIGQEFPDAAGLRRFLTTHFQEPDATEGLWFAYLVRVLKDELDADAHRELLALFGYQGGAVDDNYRAFKTTGYAPLLALDRLDKKLQIEDRRIFVGYDELDTLGGFDWTAMGFAIRGLISFWANYARRWQRLRPKIFLRTDLFRRHTEMLGADISKLAANRAELFWSDRNLYAMLVKRVANASDALRAYCTDAKVEFQEDPILGVIPALKRVEDARPLIERMAGPFMGGNINGVFVSATQEMENPKATHQRLLHHTSLRRAVDAVSQEHVQEAKTHEWPWLHGVAGRLKGEQVPLERREIERFLKKNWEDSWGEGAPIRPPADDPHELANYLVELGILRARSDGRVDAPDLFLSGLGLKRKGGVKRK